MATDPTVHDAHDHMGGVLFIAQPVVLLDEQPAHGAPGYSGRVLIHADTVVVRGRHWLPGRTVQIIARRIESDHGTIDVSGQPAASFDPQKVEPSLNGKPGATTEQAGGRDGAPGEDGHAGGRLDILAGEVVGALRLQANGSAGGHGQRGGDGATPAPGRNGEDGQFTRHEPPEGKFGAYVVRSYGSRWYWEMAYGQKGAAAPRGGRAGAPGKPGHGGEGGRIVLKHVAALSPQPALEAVGAPPGLMGTPGAPGSAGVPGIGGRNRLYEYHWYNNHSEHLADEDNGDVREIVGRFALPLRAGHEEGGGPGEVPPAPAPGAAGAAGQATITQVAASDLHYSVDIEYLRFLLTIADEAASCGQVTYARERYRWLEALTPPTAQRSEARHALRETAVARLQALQAQPEPTAA